MNQQEFEEITASSKVSDRSAISLGSADNLFWFLGDDQTIYFSGEECPDSYTGCAALFAAMYELGERLGLDVSGLEIGMKGSTPFLS